MGQSKFFYNPKTCRYEPTKVSLWKITGTTILLFIFTALLFSGMITLHSKLFESENSKAFRKENDALKKHYSVIETKLGSANEMLAKIENKENELGKKLFGGSIEQKKQGNAGEKETILLADASGFRDIVSTLLDKSENLSEQSNLSNTYFSKISVSKKDLVFLMHMPSIEPVEKDGVSKLVSGFGTRVNPFHKGHYHHTGVDFAATHGSPVLATGSGKIITAVRNSTIQAGYGNYIEIDHGNGIVTQYSHLDEVNVKVGQKVTKGFTIGTVGMTGGTVAPHVHYEIILKGKNVDPVSYILEGLSAAEHQELLSLAKKPNQSLD